ncbi:MAG: monovalent cation/H+ antiporter subunit D [Desulfosoma sp.]
MNHWIVAPVVIPLAGGALLLAMARSSLPWKRGVSAVACVLQLLATWKLAVAVASGGLCVYSVGHWPAPFGIVLVVDRLAVVMLGLTAVVALMVLGYAASGEDAQGRGFHALYQLQVMGLSGTFLAGDLFNLFVFIEILLIASYGLLLQNAGSGRSRAAFHYVVMNLLGSSLFLVAVGLFYGMLGTLNLADLSVKMASVRPEDAGLVRTAAVLLLTVFGLKGALVPLHFWLPIAYTAAPGSVAALFSLLTKAGAYATMRVLPLFFGPDTGGAPNVAMPWLVPTALATVLVGTAGALAATDLRRLLSYAVLVSMGTLFAGIGLFSVQAMAASLFYLVHSTLVTAGLFVLSDVIASQRDRGSALTPGSPVPQSALLGTCFVTGGMTLAGMPPLSGFAAKVLLLQAAWGRGAVTVGVWTILLLSGLALLVALQRAGSVIFWKAEPLEGIVRGRAEHPRWPVVMLLAMSPALVVLAGPFSAICLETAVQIMDPSSYVSGVLELGLMGRRP